MAGPNWNLEPDLQTVTVTFPTDPPVALKLNIGDVETMLANLGEFRAHMLPTVPSAYQLGQKVGVIPNPAWATEPDLLNNDTLLHVRDPRFGWLHYLIPRQEAMKLVGFLQNQVAAPSLEQKSDKAN
jgi:hypothetical protein